MWSKELLMVKAFVLVVTNPPAQRIVSTQLKDLPYVVGVHEVMGPYDIVVELEAEQLSQISTVLSDSIRVIEGIKSTTSLVAFPE